jgi:hypothetical protein
MQGIFDVPNWWVFKDPLFHSCITLKNAARNVEIINKYITPGPNQMTDKLHLFCKMLLYLLYEAHSQSLITDFYSVKGTQAWNFFCDFFCRNRNLMVLRACNTRFLKIVFDSAEIFDLCTGGYKEMSSILADQQRPLIWARLWVKR